MILSKVELETNRLMITRTLSFFFFFFLHLRFCTTLQGSHFSVTGVTCLIYLPWDILTVK